MLAAEQQAAQTPEEERKSRFRSFTHKKPHQMNEKLEDIKRVIIIHKLKERKIQWAIEKKAKTTHN